MRRSNPFAEKQLVYSSAPADKTSGVVANELDCDTLILFTQTPPLGQDMTQGQFLSGL